MKCAIVGSRKFSPLTLVSDLVAALPDDFIIVSGGAAGVDRTAENAAKKRGMKTEIYHADWNKLGKAAGMIRNTDIVKACDILIAFWDGESRGTQDSIIKACKNRKKVYIIRTPVDSHTTP